MTLSPHTDRGSARNVISVEIGAEDALDDGIWLFDRDLWVAGIIDEVRRGNETAAGIGEGQCAATERLGMGRGSWQKDREYFAPAWG
jgi:hypothetical protein